MEGCQPRSFHIRVIEEHWWPTSTKCQCLCRARWTRCVMSTTKTSFHYTPTRDATEDHILFQRSHYGMADDEESSTHVSFSVYSLFYEHLDSLAGSFVLCCVWDEKKNCFLIIYLSSRHHNQIHVIMVIYKWDSHPPLVSPPTLHRLVHPHYPPTHTCPPTPTPTHPQTHLLFACIFVLSPFKSGYLKVCMVCCINWPCLVDRRLLVLMMWMWSNVLHSQAILVSTSASLEISVCDCVSAAETANSLIGSGHHRRTRMERKASG